MIDDGAMKRGWGAESANQFWEIIGPVCYAILLLTGCRQRRARLACLHRALKRRAALWGCRAATTARSEGIKPG